MARTRSKPAPKVAPSEPKTSQVATIPPSDKNPPKLFVLPKDTSEDSRILTLDNPSNGSPSRYLFCPNKGFHEFTRITTPKKVPRSWLITSDEANQEEENFGTKPQDSLAIGSGYITKSADFFIATPIDLLFLILPALAPKNAKESKQHFLTLEDHLDTLSTSSRHLKALLAQFPSLKSMIEKRMSSFCNSVDAGDETMYRISMDKVLHLLIQKAERMCKNGLPQSMEEKFIKPTLDIPVMSIKREDTNISFVSTTSTTVAEDSQDSVVQVDSQVSVEESQSTTTTTTTTTTASQSTTLTIPEDPSPSPLTTPPQVPHLLRLRTALSYLLTVYIPPTLRTTLQSLLSSPTPTSTPSTASPIPDFTPLDAHLTAIAKLKDEAAALRSISDNISRKRGYEEDEEKIAEREEKKRRKEEEEKKKKGESRSIKQLKKVDTSGMKKLSSFFAKAPVKKG